MLKKHKYFLLILLTSFLLSFYASRRGDSLEAVLLFPTTFLTILVIVAILYFLGVLPQQCADAYGKHKIVYTLIIGALVVVPLTYNLVLELAPEEIVQMTDAERNNDPDPRSRCWSSKVYGRIGPFRFHKGYGGQGGCDGGL